jgi:hypothetical protein
MESDSILTGKFLLADWGNWIASRLTGLRETGGAVWWIWQAKGGKTGTSGVL